MDQQYDLSAKEKDLVLRRAAMRASLRAEFLKQSTNPHNYSTEGGYMFDSAVQLWMSMRANHYPYFKPNWRTAIYPIFVFTVCFSYGHWFKVRRDAREKLYREGRVAYIDRDWKFV